jgi:tRNA (guanine37-N1)-methyltransferase
MNFKIFTLFPEMFPGPLGYSVVGKGLDQGLWSLDAVNIRDYASDKHRTVDDTCYGGGPGMVMRPDVIDAALKAQYAESRPQRLLYLSPRGQRFDQMLAKELAQTDTIGVLCGRFEGVDQRVLDAWSFEEVSLGDFVLSGGELAAMSLIDACARLIPGVLGDDESTREESFSEGLLEYPQYTRPFDWNGRLVPEELKSGHHEKIKAWRHKMSEELTKSRRPDLWKAYSTLLKGE